MNYTILHKPQTVVNLREVQSTREQLGVSSKGQYEALHDGKSKSCFGDSLIMNVYPCVIFSVFALSVYSIKKIRLRTLDSHFAC